MATDDFGPFELIPAEADEFTPEETLLALEDVADFAGVPSVDPDDQTEAVGFSFQFDDSTMQTTATKVYGEKAIVQRLMAAMRTPRGVYAILPPEFGRELLHHGVGMVDTPEVRAELERDIRETLLAVDDRVTGVYDFLFIHNPDDELAVVDVTVEIDDQDVRIEGALV